MYLFMCFYQVSNWITLIIFKTKAHIESLEPKHLVSVLHLYAESIQRHSISTMLKNL